MMKSDAISLHATWDVTHSLVQCIHTIHATHQVTLSSHLSLQSAYVQVIFTLLSEGPKMSEWECRQFGYVREKP